MVDVPSIVRGLRDPAARGVASNLYSTATTVAIQLATVPLLLLAFGIEDYGVWLILTAIPQYLLVADFGFTSAVGTRATELVALRRLPEARNAWFSVWCAVTLLGAALVGLVSVGLVLMPFTVGQVASSVVVPVLVVQLVYVLLWMQGGFVEAAFRADRQFPTGVAMFASIRLLENIALVAVATATGSLVASATALLVVRALATAAFALAMRARVLWLNGGQFRWDRQAVTGLAGPSGSYVLLTLGNLGNLQGYILLTGAAFGPSTVVLLNTSRIAVTMIKEFVAALNRGVMPEMTIALASMNRPRFELLYRRLGMVATVSSTLLAVVLVVIGGALIGVWTAGAVRPSVELLALLAAAMALEVQWSYRLTPLAALNAHSVGSAAYFLATAFALTGAWSVLNAGTLTELLGFLVATHAVTLVAVVVASRRILASVFVTGGGSLATSVGPLGPGDGKKSQP